MVDFNFFPIDAEDKVWALNKGNLVEAEVRSVSICFDIVTYHAVCTQPPYKGVTFDFGVSDIGSLVWKDKQSALYAAESAESKQIDLGGDNDE